MYYDDDDRSGFLQDQQPGGWLVFGRNIIKLKREMHSEPVCDTFFLLSSPLPVISTLLQSLMCVTFL